MEDSRLRAERDAFYKAQRARIGRIDAVAIVGIVLFVLFNLGDSLLIQIWAALSMTQVASGLAVYLAAASEERHLWLRIAEVWWYRGTSFTWAIMPLLIEDRVANDNVAWIVAFFVIFGLAADAVYMPQTYDTNLKLSGALYSLPALFVLGLEQQWVPAAAIVGILLHVTTGAQGITRIVNELTEKSVRARDAEANALEQSKTDQLTGLYNRAGILEAVKSLREDPNTTKISVCFADLDGFKAINDQYGYALGDQTLVEFGLAIAGLLPAGWSVGRFGGDEFVAAGPGDSGPDVAQAIADVVIRPMAAAPSSRAVRASVGVSVMEASEANSLTMLHFAGTAVREAKDLAGKPVVQSSDVLQARSARRAQLESELPKALSSGAITGVGQAQIELATGQLRGIELLARWHRGEEVVSPGEFLPLIDRIGFDHEFDLLMVSNALDLIVQTSDTDLTVSVNVSTTRIADEIFAEQLTQMLQEKGAEATRLTLEVTESDDLDLDDDTIDRINALVALGVGLSIDDFGTGYSSLTRLVAMPFSELKLDISLVQRVGEPNVDDLLRSISDFAHRNEIVVVAEGVETEAQREAIVSLGVECVQGFLYGRPGPVDELLSRFASKLRAKPEWRSAA